MIRVVFESIPAGFCGFQMSGHADFAPQGEDIVCAAVTSAMLLTINGITEILDVRATAEVGENQVHFELPISGPQSARDFLSALKLHLDVLSEDYPNTIEINILEV